MNSTSNSCKKNLNSPINKNIYSKPLKRRKEFPMQTSYPKLVKMKQKQQLELLGVEENKSISNFSIHRFSSKISY